MIIISFLLGIVSEILFIFLEKKKNIKFYVLYSLAMQAIMMYVLTNMLSGIAFMLALIYVLIFIKNVKVTN